MSRFAPPFSASKETASDDRSIVDVPTPVPNSVHSAQPSPSGVRNEQPYTSALRSAQPSTSAGHSAHQDSGNTTLPPPKDGETNEVCYLFMKVSPFKLYLRKEIKEQEQ